jgi:hypothetical protein
VLKLVSLLLITTIEYRNFTKANTWMTMAWRLLGMARTVRAVALEPIRDGGRIER